jgi:hypothetical protein
MPSDSTKRDQWRAPWRSSAEALPFDIYIGIACLYGYTENQGWLSVRTFKEGRERN